MQPAAAIGPLPSFPPFLFLKNKYNLTENRVCGFNKVYPELRRDHFHEKNISTQQYSPGPDPRFFGTDEHPGRPECHQAPTG
jgi:hypothetical protein